MTVKTAQVAHAPLRKFKFTNVVTLGAPWVTVGLAVAVGVVVFVGRAVAVLVGVSVRVAVFVMVGLGEAVAVGGASGN